MNDLERARLLRVKQVLEDALSVSIARRPMHAQSKIRAALREIEQLIGMCNHADTRRGVEDPVDME